jgi:hypothetical protein
LPFPDADPGVDSPIAEPACPTSSDSVAGIMIPGFYLAAPKEKGILIAVDDRGKEEWLPT